MTAQLRNEQIVIIGFPAWEGEYLKSTVQLATELARHNEVLYVEYPFTWKDALMGRLGKSKAPWRRILGREDRLRKLQLSNGAEINVLTLPPMVPVNFISSDLLYDTLMLTNAQKAYGTIKSAMNALQIARPVVINAFNPFLGAFLARQFGEKALLYYCYDEIGAAHWAGKHGPRLEARLLRQVDAVVSSSQPLFAAKKQLASRSFLVKNGVDFDLFSQKTTSKPADRIGYLGSLDERVDYDLLESVIRKLAHRQFCFVGRVTSPEAERLRGLPNVEIVGSQPPASLPAWVQRFGVCMIPFLKNELTAGIYPLKINEYFAAGKPVVATDFGDMSDFEGLANIAHSPDEFALMLELAMLGDGDEKTPDRIAFARENAWSKRAEQFGQAIQSVVAEKVRAAAYGEPVWMPDNFNRWGEACEPFFKAGKEKGRQGKRIEETRALPSFSLALH